MDAEEIITLLALEPHPEGGYYRETWAGPGEKRASGTAIYFLLKGEEKSHWHRVDAAEIWHYYAGAPVRLRVAATDAGPLTLFTLGQDLAEGHRPQLIVPEDYWQSAESLGEWSLVGCTVSPGFRFEGFELAGPEFDIPLGE